MNDFHIIRTGPTIEQGYQRKFTPYDAADIHFKSKEYIFDSIKFHRAEGRKTVVVTHMGPSLKSVPKRFFGNQLNGAYVSNLDEEVIATEPDIWIHGHTHDSFDYMLGETRVMVNPRGYVGHALNKHFDADKFIEL